jgi:sodium transport system permease protein
MKMNWKNVRLIFLREVRDQVRDRRTLFMIVVLPLLLYPGLAIGMVQISFLFREQPRTVVLLGAESLPPNPPLLTGNRFAKNWFAFPDDAEKLHVISDAQPPAPSDNLEHDKTTGQLLTEARALRPLIEQANQLEEGLEAARTAKKESEAAAIAEKIRNIKEELAQQFTATKIQVLILIPNGLKEQIERTNQRLIARDKASLPPAAHEAILRPLVVENSADEKSAFAYQRVKMLLAAWEHAILEQRLADAKLPATLSTPVNPAPLDVAVPRQLSANLWSKLFPTLLIIMAVTGAFYPAVDVAAGEKERGTMETLLICPARRSEIVLGKFFTVLTFSVSTVLLNLLSMGITGKYVMALARNEALAKAGAGALSFPGVWEMLWLLILLVPLAAFYSSISLALATFARSTKEGQYYLTPLLLVTLGLTLFCLSPAVEIEPFYSILPVVGPALLLKEVLAAPENTGVLIYAIPVLLTSIAYSLAGLWWAITMFQREDVLFREAERFDVRLWIRHLLRDKEPTPSSAEAILCFVLTLLLQFVALRFMRPAAISADGKLDGTEMLRLLLIQQLVLVASPALFMGIMLTTSFVRTFRLRIPQLRYLLMACVLPLALHPLTVVLQNWLQGWFFPPPPKSVVDLLSALGDPGIPLWLLILAMAAAPAICEETAFRGFILSGFLRSARPGIAIVLTSIAFGVMHMIPQQVFNATLLGLILGLFAVRSGSLLPAMVFHFLYNATEVLRMRAASEHWKFPSVFDPFVTVVTQEDQTTITYNWPTLLIAGVVSAMVIARLVYVAERRVSPQFDEEGPHDKTGMTPVIPAHPVQAR